MSYYDIYLSCYKFSFNFTEVRTLHVKVLEEILTLTWITTVSFTKSSIMWDAKLAFVKQSHLVSLPSFERYCVTIIFWNFYDLRISTMNYNMQLVKGEVVAPSSKLMQQNKSFTSWDKYFSSVAKALFLIQFSAGCGSTLL
jgi:hypothetical protein